MPTTRFALRHALLGLLGVGALNAPAGEPVRRLYLMTTETGMPHLQESLRYAVVTEQRCLDPADLSDAFWMLRDVSLQDCKLVKSDHSATASTYRLVCTGGHGTTGSASWQLGSGAINGRLDVRLGGKNMTFYQRITATPRGPCA